MPTIKDIAELAGVSHGTVSNVLNKRGNVSSEKIHLVEKAARELGYTINAQAKQLRQGHTNKVCVIVPSIEVRQYRDLFMGIHEELKPYGYEMDVYFSQDLNYEEEKLLYKIMAMKPAAVVVVSSFLRNSGIFSYQACDETVRSASLIQETPFIFVERSVRNAPENSYYAGFDFQKAGREVAERCIREGHQNIALFYENEKYSNSKQFRNGIVEVLEEHDCRYRAYSSSSAMDLNRAFEILSDSEIFDAVITDRMERAECLGSACRHRRVDPEPQIYTLASKSIDLENRMYRYELNYKYCGKQIAKNIVRIAKNEILSNKIWMMENDGFGGSEFQKERRSSHTLRFLSLTSSTTQAIRYLLPEFTRKTGIEVNLVDVSYEELHKYVSGMARGGTIAYDLIRMDMIWLSRYGSKIFRPFDLSEACVKHIVSHFSDALTDEYFKVHGEPYVLPFDPSVQVLYYRKDLFEDALINREFYEAYKRPLRVPQTFDEYRDVAEFFTRKYNKKSPVPFGILLAYGAAAVAACDFLPFLKEKQVEIFDEAGRVVINTDMVKQVLNAYREMNAFTDGKIYHWWGQLTDQFAAGNTAMSIVFSNLANEIVMNSESNIVGKVGFAAVPGQSPLLGGGVIGITRNTKKTEECMEFLRWLYDEKTASRITALGGYVNHKNLVKNQDVWERYPWIAGVEKAFAIGTRRYENEKNEKFDECLFEDILGEAIRSVLLELQTIDEALDEAQKKCDEAFGA